MASTDAHPLPLKAAAYRVTFPIIDSTGLLVTGATGLDSEISKDGGTFVDCTNEATEIATASGIYYLDISSTEMTADTVAIIVKTTSVGARTTPLVLYPQEADDLRVAVTHWVATALASPDTAGYPKVTIKDGTGAGEIDTTSGGVLVAALAANAITAASIAADAITAAKVADGTIDAATFAAGAINAAAIAADAITAAKVADGTIDAATFAAGAINAAAIATDAIGAAELAADAVTEIQSGLATAAALATVQADTDNIQTRLPTALVSGRMDSDVGAIQPGAIGAAAIATDAIGALELAAGAATEIAAAVWDEARAGHVTAGTFGQGVASVQGNVTGSVASVTGAVGSVTGAVGSVAAGGIAAASFAAGAIDAGAIATDAIGAAELAASAVTEIQAGLATAAAQVTAQADLDDLQTRLPVALVSGRMDSDVGAIQAGAITAAALATDAVDADALAADAVLEIVDAFLKRDMAAVTGEADRSLLNALRFIRNKWSVAGSTLTVTKEDDTTTAWTAAVVGTAGADPITVVDPA